MLTTETSLDIRRIRKRNRNLMPFEQHKITAAMSKALAATNTDCHRPEELSDKVVERLLASGYSDTVIPSVESVQDMVETVLIDTNHANAAKAYILYRHEHNMQREEKCNILNTEMLDGVARSFDANALRVLAARYLKKDDAGKTSEAPAGLFSRVAILVGLGDMMYGLPHDGEPDPEEALSWLDRLEEIGHIRVGRYEINEYHLKALVMMYVEMARAGKIGIRFGDLLDGLRSGRMGCPTADEYYDLMTLQKYMPNSPTLMNAGMRLGQLSACFVLGMEDSLDLIMKTNTDAARIFQSGGGVGINYSNLRECGDIVASTSGVASGPVSFMQIINTITEVVKQGGKRRGANMGIMEAWHPDIEEFVGKKNKPHVLENFNISVGIWEDFWNAAFGEGDGRYDLRSPRTGKPVRTANAKNIMDMIASSAWRGAEPGLIFLDTINRRNVLAKARGTAIRATNPCGEQSLYPNESCNLGSINLSAMAHKNGNKYEFDWEEYEKVIRQTTRFLDTIIDVNRYPMPEIDVASKETRRIGLGIMGLADLLYKLRITYNSATGYDLMSRLAEFLTYHSMDESVNLAQERGRFPLCDRTGYGDGDIPVEGYYAGDGTCDWDGLVKRIREYGIRNVVTTTVAPTGTIAMIAECSNGVEPVFALTYEKRVTIGGFSYSNPILGAALREEGINPHELFRQIASNHGSLAGIEDVPEWMRDVFVTAMDIHWADHILAQASWQKWVSNAIAKTINMPHESTIEDVKSAYIMAHDLGLKGITVYRDGSRDKQVLHAGSGGRVPVPSRVASVRMAEGDQAAPPEIACSEACVAADGGVPVAANGGQEEKCQECDGVLVITEGCCVCMSCGHSSCSV